MQVGIEETLERYESHMHLNLGLCTLSSSTPLTPCLLPLHKLPAEHNKVFIPNEEEDTVNKPDKNIFVFCKVLEDIGAIPLDER